MTRLHVHVHTYDAGWEESKHPRSPSGEFGSGGGGGGGSKKPAPRTKRVATSPGYLESHEVHHEGEHIGHVHKHEGSHVVATGNISQGRSPAYWAAVNKQRTRIGRHKTKSGAVQHLVWHHTENKPKTTDAGCGCGCTKCRQRLPD